MQLISEGILYRGPAMLRQSTRDLRACSLVSEKNSNASYDMKIAIIFSLTIIVLLDLKVADGSPHGVVRSRRDTDLQVCQPGARKKEDCNSCFCIANGSGWACTRRGCYDTHIITLPVGDPSERAKREVHGRMGDPDFRCDPYSRFKSEDNCNWCTCTSDGRNAYCTLIWCEAFNADALRPRY